MPHHNGGHGVRTAPVTRAGGHPETPGQWPVRMVPTIACDRVAAHLDDAESRGEVSPRVPLLVVIRDKLAIALREES